MPATAILPNPLIPRAARGLNGVNSSAPAVGLLVLNVALSHPDAQTGEYRIALSP